MTKSDSENARIWKTELEGIQKAIAADSMTETELLDWYKATDDFRFEADVFDPNFTNENLEFISQDYVDGCILNIELTPYFIEALV